MSKIISGLLILVLLVSVLTIAGETGTLKGVILDSQTNEFVCGASLISLGGEFLICTDHAGNFISDEIEPGTYSVSIDKLGYEGKILAEINVIADSETVLEISLTPKEYLHKQSNRANRYWKAPDQLKAAQGMQFVFKYGETIPAKYTCDSIDISPGVTFGVTPDSTKSYALICDDPDAPGGTWVHWIMFNIPPQTESLGEDFVNSLAFKIRTTSGPRTNFIQGINDFGKFGYGGPCPPVGPAHRYFFKLYALDTVLQFDEKDIQKGITKDMLLKAMEGHVLAESVYMGKYKR